MTWSDFHKKTQDLPPRALLVEALSCANGVGEALDFGCGSMADTKHLIRLGYKVTSIDSAPLEEIPPGKFVRTRFEDYQYEAERFVLVNAQFAIPFISASEYERVITSLLGTVKVGGLFCGNFFGEKDEWCGKGVVCDTRAAVEARFAGWDIIKFDERMYVKKPAFGEEKKWHVIDVIAKRKT